MKEPRWSYYANPHAGGEPFDDKAYQADLNRRVCRGCGDPGGALVVVEDQERYCHQCLYRFHGLLMGYDQITPGLLAYLRKERGQ